MQILQPKHTKLKSDEIKELVDKYNISISQLPVIKLGDPGLPENCFKGDVIKILRRENEITRFYFRVVV